jgi:hypothetical protein
LPFKSTFYYAAGRGSRALLYLSALLLLFFINYGILNKTEEKEPSFQEGLLVLR